jgi:hypothetical protein
MWTEEERKGIRRRTKTGARNKMRKMKEKPR